MTDMRVDYRGVVAQVFPQATHHECLFHALQEVREHAKEAYGTNYAETHPEVKRLLEEIDRIFDARTKRTARRRYEKVLAQRETFVTQTPEAAAIFDFLERHWPYLVDAIESRIVPTTNNATEQVIRIFTQHYETFCGFESIESAQLYLGVFEKIYRFTPFSDACPEPAEGMPRSASGAGALSNWLATRSRNCRWPNSSAGWPSNGPLQPSRGLSPMCDAHEGRFDEKTELWYIIRRR